MSSVPLQTVWEPLQHTPVAGAKHEPLCASSKAEQDRGGGVANGSGSEPSDGTDSPWLELVRIHVGCEGRDMSFECHDALTGHAAQLQRRTKNVVQLWGEYAPAWRLDVRRRRHRGIRCLQGTLRCSH